MTLVVIIAAPLLAAVLAVPAQRVAVRAPSILAVGAGVITLAAALMSLSSIAAGEIWQIGLSWLPTLMEWSAPLLQHTLSGHNER